MLKYQVLKLLLKKVTFYEINGEIWATYFSKSNFRKRAQAVPKHICSLNLIQRDPIVCSSNLDNISCEVKKNRARNVKTEQNHNFPISDDPFV